MRKTHHSALVVIPPPRIWPPIQTLRQRYDRQVRRWMPHINILYPFVSPEDFAEAIPRVRRVAAGFEPFRVTLARFARFRHSPGYYTIWLAPEPDTPLKALHHQLVPSFPNAMTWTTFPRGTHPT